MHLYEFYLIYQEYKKRVATKNGNPSKRLGIASDFTITELSQTS